MELVSGFVLLGLTDPYQNLTFMPLNKKPATYINWNTNQPDQQYAGAAEYCSVVLSRTIYDTSCQRTFDQALCQRVTCKPISLFEFFGENMFYYCFFALFNYYQNIEQEMISNVVSTVLPELFFM